MEMSPDGPYVDEAHYREEMVTEWIAGSEAIPDDVIARWTVELAQRRPQKQPRKLPPKAAHAPREEALALSFPVAAEMLGYSVDHFERHVASDLRIIVKGRRKTVPRAELIRWVEASAARALKGR
jgi:hypothetical protein